MKKISPPNGKKLLPGIIQAAHASGAILKRYWEKIDQAPLTIKEKKGAGLVTNADIESEKACVKALRKLRPDFSFLTEEATTKEVPAQGRWIIDPLDGTTNFVHGFPMFCVSLAAEWDGKIIAGVIYHPILGDTYYATPGGGAWLLTPNGRKKRKLKVSNTKTLADSLLSTGFTYRGNTIFHTEMLAFEELSNIARAIRRPGSAALDLAYVARGVFDGFWERRLSPWDVAAGSLIVSEAGGKMTNFSNQIISVEGAEVCAANPPLHSKLLQSINLTNPVKIPKLKDR